MLAGGDDRLELRTVMKAPGKLIPATTLGRRFLAIWSIDGLVVMLIAIGVGAWLYRDNVRPRMRRPRPDAYAHVPVQLITPTEDAFLSERLYDDLERWAPDLVRRTLPAKHWVPRTRPDQLAAWITEFVTAREEPATRAPEQKAPGRYADRFGGQNQVIFGAEYSRARNAYQQMFAYAVLTPERTAFLRKASRRVPGSRAPASPSTASTSAPMRSANAASPAKAPGSMPTRKCPTAGGGPSATRKELDSKAKHAPVSAAAITSTISANNSNGDL